MFCRITEMSCICSLARKPGRGLPFPFTTKNSTLYFLPFLGFTTWTRFLPIGFSSALLYMTRVTSALSNKDRLPSPYTSSKDASGATSPITVISEVWVNVLFPIVITHRKVIPANFFVSRRIPSKESAGLGRYGRRDDREPNDGSRVCSCHFRGGDKKASPEVFERNKSKLFDFEEPKPLKRGTKRKSCPLKENFWTSIKVLSENILFTKLPEMANRRELGVR
ncbi:hypothetical protein P5673_012581, partial [Acropora cervicornis]